MSRTSVQREEGVRRWCQLLCNTPEMCPWNYVIVSFHCCLSSCLCHLQDLPSAFSSDLFTLAAGGCPRLCPLKCPEAAQPQQGLTWLLILQGTAEHTALLPPLSWTCFKWRWCRTWFQKQGRSGRQLELRICSSKQDWWFWVTPCSIEWEHPLVQVNLVLLSASICTRHLAILQLRTRSIWKQQSFCALLLQESETWKVWWFSCLSQKLV